LLGDAGDRALSVAILAGGKSSRMGQDKAFLRFSGRSFISIIADKMKLVATQVHIVIGQKNKADFSSVLDSDFYLVNDRYSLAGPIGGLLTALEVARSPYLAVVACDLPLVKPELILSLFKAIGMHSAIIPRWQSGKLEPLCAIYEREKTREALRMTLAQGGSACRHMISKLENPKFVDVDDLRLVDPDLGSFTNVNTQEDYLTLSDATVPALIQTHERLYYSA
jgi:molybdopterin-guanine dinucleotide biosynthesis protein A